jgi:arginine N-succinyltransferase
LTYVIRAARADDLQSLYEMAKRTGGGFTNLPPDKKALRAKLDRAEAGFQHPSDEPSDQLYLMILEDSATGEVWGTCQIFGKVGERWPFYSYRIGTDSKHSEQLGRTFQAKVLMLSNDLNGCSEVGGLFLHPAARAGGLGLLLSRSRYLFIAGHRGRFCDRILAELRGVIDEAGSSPFWDGVAGKFFGMSFQEADQFNAMHGNQLIADLMPKHPVYIAMLQDSARSVIGVPHPTGRAAMRMLENEGFGFDHYIDIFDGGPTMTARTDQVASIAHAKRTPLSAIVADAKAQHGKEALIAAGELANFRCCFGVITDTGAVEQSVADLLGASIGDELMWIER